MGNPMTNKEKTMEEEREPKYTEVKIGTYSILIPDDQEYSTYYVSSMDKRNVFKELNIIETIRVTTKDLWELVGIMKERENNVTQRTKEITNGRL